MKEGLLTKTYFLIFCGYVFFIPQFSVEEGSKYNILYYALYYILTLFSLIQIFFSLYARELILPFKKNKSLLLILIFLLISATSYFWSEANNPIVSSYNILKSIILILPVFLLNFSKNKLETLYKIYFTGSIFGSFQVIYNYYFLAEYSYGIKRSFLIGIDANESAIYIAIGYSLALFYFFTKKNIWYLFFTIPQILAVFYTGSRTGFVAIFISTIISLYYFNILKFKLSSIFIVLVMIGIFFLLPSIVPSENLNRIMNIRTDISTGQMSGRVQIWTEALRLIPKKLYFGYGMNSFSDILEKHFMRFNAHNVFLKAQFELGLLGLSVLILWLINFGKMIFKNNTLFRPVLIISYVLILISFMQLSWIYHINFLVLISIFLVTSGSSEESSG